MSTSVTIDPNKKPTPLSITLIGAINGLLVGVIEEQARVSYLGYQMSRAAKDFAAFARQEGGGYTFVEPTRDPFIPLLTVVVFAAVSFLIYRYLLSRPKSLLLIWFTLGAVALGGGYFMSTSNPNILSFVWILTFASVCYFVHRLWTKHRDSLFLLWLVNGVSAVLVVALGVQLVGLLFYWPELRSPLLWLLCLLGVIATNLIYGAVIQFIFDRFSARKMEQASA